MKQQIDDRTFLCEGEQGATVCAERDKCLRYTSKNSYHMPRLRMLCDEGYNRMIGVGDEKAN